MIDAIAYHQEMTMTNRKVKAALKKLTKCPFCWIRKICQGWHPGHQPSLQRKGKNSSTLYQLNSFIAKFGFLQRSYIGYNNISDHKDGAFWEASRIQDTSNQKIIAMRICNGPKIYKSIGPQKHVTTYPMTILILENNSNLACFTIVCINSII